MWIYSTFFKNKYLRVTPHNLNRKRCLLWRVPRDCQTNKDIVLCLDGCTTGSDSTGELCLFEVIIHGHTGRMTLFTENPTPFLTYLSLTHTQETTWILNDISDPTSNGSFLDFTKTLPQLVLFSWWVLQLFHTIIFKSNIMLAFLSY